MKHVKLRTTRKQKGYSQQQVADIIPTEVSNYSRKENGYIKITRKEWEKIARFLNVKVEEICDDFNEDINEGINLDSLDKYELLEAENKILKRKIDLLKIQLDVLKSIIG